MGKEYWVSLPIAGVLSINIESATSEEDAINQALAQDWNIDFKQGAGADMELNELEAYDKLITGNVVHVSLWEAEAEEV